MNPTEVMDALRLAAETMIRDITAQLPSLLSAGILLLGGWGLAWVLSRLATRVATRFTHVLEAPATKKAVAQLGIRRRLPDMIGMFVFWAVFVVAVGAAAEAAGLPVFATLMSQLVSLVPRILLGGLIVVTGLVLARLAREGTVAAARAGGLSEGDLLGRGVQIAIITAAVVAGVEQVGIDSQFVTATLVVTIGALLGGTALAFALGARTEVSNIVAMHYVRLSFKTGQQIAVGDVRGRVRKFDTNAVVVEMGGRRVRIPGKLFSEQVSHIEVADE